jgi:hypothetical protein
VTTPSDADALAALATLRAWLGAGASPHVVYDQAHLPPGISRDNFLRLHRVRSREGVEGWSRRGKARLVTSEAWARELAAETVRARTRTPEGPPAKHPANDARDVDAEIDRVLGIRTTAKRTAG